MTQLFGILNITPDSFSDGGLFLEPEKAFAQAKLLIDKGAHYLDIGAQSTKPNTENVSLEAEWDRLAPILDGLIDRYHEQISLDTMKTEIAQRFVDLGGTIINDVSGFKDPSMVEVAAKMCNKNKDAFIIVNHFPGKTVEEVHEQKISSINRVLNELMYKKEQLVNEGISAKQIVLDPGIGFGKTMDLNWKLLEFAKLVPEERVLIGHSRKRFLGENRFDTEVNVLAGQKAIKSGAEFLRVHEIEPYII